MNELSEQLRHLTNKVAKLERENARLKRVFKAIFSKAGLRLDHNYEYYFVCFDGEQSAMLTKREFEDFGRVLKDLGDKE